MPEISEIPQLFKEERSKQEILADAYPQVVKRIEEINRAGVYGDYKARWTFGMVFEEMAINERIVTRPETETQTGVRNIIEDAIRNSQSTLGHTTSTPDFVSVILDKEGKLVIDEIIDMKSSFRALQRSANKGQPKHTLETMENIVGVINQIISGADIESIKSRDSLNPGENNKRTAFLRSIKEKITQLGIKEKISFSKDLKYVVVLPKGEEGIEPGYVPYIELYKDQKPVPKEIIHSKFSKRDIHQIIDHYSETP